MRFYNVSYKDENGKEHVEEFYTTTKAKACMKEHPGSIGTIINEFSNGDWEKVGEFTCD